MEKPNFKTKFCYPYDLVKNLPNFPLQHVIPCSVLYYNHPKGGLLLTCPSADLKFFKVNLSTNPEPYLRFRMLNIDQKAYAIEIHLVFDNERILKIHLNPAVAPTQEFLKLCLKTKMISFHYNNMSKNFFASSIMELDDDHIEWFKRNYGLAKRLSKTNDYLMVCRELFHEMKSDQRLYHYFEKDGIDCFIRKGSIVANFDETSESFPLAAQKKMWN